MKILIHYALNASCREDRKEAWQLCRSFLERVCMREAIIAKVATLLSYCVSPGEIDPSYTLELLAKKADLCVAFCGIGSAGFGHSSSGLGLYLSRSDTPTLAFYESWADVGLPAYYLPKFTSTHVWCEDDDLQFLFNGAVSHFKRTRNLILGLPVTD
jgi:hypothetical protein